MHFYTFFESLTTIFSTFFIDLCFTAAAVVFAAAFPSVAPPAAAAAAAAGGLLALPHPVPRDADDALGRHGVVAADQEVVAVGEVLDGGRGLQQPDAALDHCAGADAVLLLKGDQTQLLDAAKDDLKSCAMNRLM